jgi:hypothetical protein
MPTAPRSSTKAHSAAIRLTTSSAVKICGISTALEHAPPARRDLWLIFSGSRAYGFRPVIPDIDIWRAATLMLKRYGENAQQESAARADELANEGDHDAPRFGA